MLRKNVGPIEAKSAAALGMLLILLSQQKGPSILKHARHTSEPDAPLVPAYRAKRPTDVPPECGAHRPSYSGKRSLDYWRRRHHFAI